MAEEKAPTGRILGGLALIGLLIYGVRAATSIRPKPTLERIYTRELMVFLRRRNPA